MEENLQKGFSDGDEELPPPGGDVCGKKPADPPLGAGYGEWVCNTTTKQWQWEPVA